MEAKTIGKAATAGKRRGPPDPQLRRALLRAMQGALRRSLVLLPMTEDDDKLQEWLGSMLGFAE
jgi:hypothetical protein